MRRLLIVDDEPRQRRGLANLVRKLRPVLDVLEAGNGMEALDIIAKTLPDAVLSDIRMPMGDGFLLGEKLRELNPDIALAYVSAHEEFDYATRALRLGATEYLLKPYTIERVEATIAALEQKAEQQRYAPPRTQLRTEQVEPHIEHCIAYIREHFDKPLILSELGELFYFSPNYLSALIKSHTGVAFKQYLQALRMEAALARLGSSDERVSDIAQRVGFADPAYFNRIFKKQYGVSPDSYRRSVKSRLAADEEKRP